MNPKRIGLLCILLLLWIVVYSWTPEMAIKKYVFSKGNAIEAFNLEIRPTNINDIQYGRQYIVKGYYDEPGPVEIPFFYVKKDFRGWYVSGAGTGP